MKCGSTMCWNCDGDIFLIIIMIIKKVPEFGIPFIGNCINVDHCDQLNFLAKKICQIETNDSVFLPGNGYHLLLCVFHILHNLLLHVALHKLLTQQQETSDQL